LDKKTAETIIQMVKEKKPENVEQLVNLLKEKFNIPEHKIIEYILQLQSEGKIKLIKPSKSTPQSLIAYLKTEETRWYWVTMILTATATLVVFAIPENFFPLVYIRYLLGAIFVLWLPGYSFIKLLFPTEDKNKKPSENLDTIIHIALSIGLSLALVPIVGLLLNYTPWGIRLTPIVLSLFALTTVFATAAVIREHQTKIKTPA
jgi:hypothetical protein